MTKHLLRIAAATALMMLIILLPFMPGSYDPLAAHLSGLARVFEQPAADLATREFVVYNPRDEQVATNHAIDLLQYSSEHLERTRGYYAVHATRHTHWKYFWFD